MGTDRMVELTAKEEDGWKGDKIVWSEKWNGKDRIAKVNGGMVNGGMMWNDVE